MENTVPPDAITPAQRVMAEGMVNMNARGADPYVQVKQRRALVQRMIDDMDRLLVGWRNNTFTKVKSSQQGELEQPLTVTLNAEQIDALVQEHLRLRRIVENVRRDVIDYDMGERSNLSMFHPTPPYQPPVQADPDLAGAIGIGQAVSSGRY